ncbi:MAG: fibronectin type III domain-containing protein, partial [Kiritimatiellae bacterium]|nr:fibronectin type III domain-containing protein [Kiritimatiellia bacterium]
MNRGTGRCCLGPLSGITLWLVLSVCLQAATVATPTFTKTRGFYTATFSVSLSCATSGATIRFTTDGSKPTPSHGTVYSGAFSISDTTCLRAVGCKSGYTTSTTMTHTYVFPDKVKNQPNYMSGENWSDAAARMNTQMDPSIVGSSTYSSRVVPALKAIPSMSIAMSYADLFGDANGICHYPNSETRGLGGERECSVEMIGKDGSSKFQLNCGIRIFGNSSHVDRILAKKSFRLLFKGAYGPKKLNYALFADAPNEAGSAVSVLDSVVLRGGHNNMWGGWEAFNPSTQRITYTRDQWVRDSQIAMSGYGYHGTFVHLYLNGVYWGLYNPCEGTEPCFMRDYFGGNKEDWFTTTHDTRSQDSHHGSYTQWAYLHSTLRKKDLSVAANYTAVTQYLDVENYVDYLILNWYAGVGDWPHKNYGASNRNSPAGPVRYFVWDAESCFIDVAGRSSDGAWIHYDYLRATPSSLSGLLWQKLLANRDFKTTFADRLYKHCHHDGALTDAKAKARFDVLNSRVDKAVIAESARWGDCIEDRISLTYNRDTHWVNAKNAIRNSMTGNAADFESICVSKGFYPGIKPPEFVQRGGTVAAGYKVTLSNPNGSTGQIYYTTDGSDPRKSGGALGASAALYGAPLTLTATATVRARVYKTAATWSALNLATFTVTGSVVTVPTAPSGLAAAAQSTTSIRLTWTDNSGNETVFKVDRSPDGSSWTRVAEPAANTTAWTDSGLAAGTKYYYRVKASNSAGDSGYSNVATATTDESLPAQPSNLAAASLSSTSIKVTWTDTSDNETQFKIRRSLDGADWDTLAPVFPAANATSYTDSGLSGGTTYYYKIRSENAAGVSAYTAPVAATTGVATPAAPSGLTATAVSSTSVALSWTDNASNETQYKIDRRRSGTDTWVRVAEPGANTTAYTDSGLSPNTDYYYMVKASNAAGNSPYSNVAPVTTDETVPAQPANLAALSLSATSIQVTWTDTSDNETQFKIRR